MNSVEELQEKFGISNASAVKMVSAYKARIGQTNGDYVITDITYIGDGTKIVEETCSVCGSVITRQMKNGRNKWSELQRFCPNEEMERKEERLLIRQEHKENERKEKAKSKGNALLQEVGKTYGEFTIVSTDKSSKIIGKCNICGAEKHMDYDCIKSGFRKDFICHKHRKQEEKYTNEYIGKKNNMLEIIGITRDEKVRGKRLLCKCECGNICTVKPRFWETSQVKSCGCFYESKKVVHTPELDRLRSIRNGMINRCYNKNDDAYKYYGYRGIEVCQEWLDSFDSFSEWALNNGYSNELTIDRINNDGNYEPSNCRWATYKQQANNQRKRYTAKIYEMGGKPISIFEIGKIYGIEPFRISKAIKETNNLNDAIKLAMERQIEKERKNG